MKFKIGFILIFCIISANAFTFDSKLRVKRSSEEGFFDKLKDGISDLASDVKRITTKGYEEVKNFFSSDRSVGDYRIDQLDVRFGEDGTPVTPKIVQNSNLIIDDNLKREKREVESLDEHAMDEIIKSIEDHLGELTTEGNFSPF